MSKLRKATARSSGAFVLGVLLFAASPAAAQGTAVVCGTITDASGGIMPGVAVSVERDAAPPLKAVTDSTGDYVFAAVEPGVYRVVFSQAGFKKAVRNGVLVNAGREFRVDQKMEVGSAEEPVDFISASVAYDRPRPVVGSTFTKDIVTAVPTRRLGPPRPIDMTAGMHSCKIEK